MSASCIPSLSRNVFNYPAIIVFQDQNKAKMFIKSRKIDLAKLPRLMASSLCLGGREDINGAMKTYPLNF